jgi:IS30 family transposase
MPGRPKIHKSRTWLIQKLYTEKLSIEEIARQAGVTAMTIYRELEAQKIAR